MLRKDPASSSLPDLLRGEPSTPAAWLSHAEARAVWAAPATFGVGGSSQGRAEGTPEQTVRLPSLCQLVPQSGGTCALSRTSDMLFTLWPQTPFQCGQLCQRRSRRRHPHPPLLWVTCSAPTSFPEVSFRHLTLEHRDLLAGLGPASCPCSPLGGGEGGFQEGDLLP